MEEKRVGFLQAFKLFFTHYVDFEGKSTRAAYWWWQLWELLVGIIFGVILVFSLVLPLTMHADGEISGTVVAGMIAPLLIMVLWGLGTLVPRISLLVRRYRDAGVNPLLVLLTLGAPYLIGQFLSMQMLITMPTALENSLADSNVLLTAVTLHPWMFGIGYGLVIVLEIFNFVVTLLPSSKKRRFM